MGNQFPELFHRLIDLLEYSGSGSFRANTGQGTRQGEKKRITSQIDLAYRRI